MDYLITGGAGFIGSHLTEYLLKKGNRVTVLDNFISGDPRNLPRIREKGAKIIKGSVLDKELVYSLADKCDKMIHLAAVVGVRLAMARGIETMRVSCLGTERVLEAAVACKKEVFIASSSAIYGKIRAVPVKEEDDVLLGSSNKESWLYSVGKMAEEHLALSYFREKGARIKIGRFFNVIGPYQVGTYGMVVPTFIKKALAGKPLPVYGDGSQTRTFAYIKDALRVVEIIMKRGRTGGVYNIGSTGEITILDLAQKIIVMTGSSSEIIMIPFQEAFGDRFEETARRVPDIRRLRDLGYSPRYCLNEALKEIIDFHLSG